VSARVAPDDNLVACESRDPGYQSSEERAHPCWVRMTRFSDARIQGSAKSSRWWEDFWPLGCVILYPGAGSPGLRKAMTRVVCYQ